MTPTDVFSAVFILAVIGIALAVDVYFIRRGGEANSISFRTTTWAMKYPMIPFMLGLFIGLLFGHLFWTNHAWCDSLKP